jgi:dTDP-4-dehydrorhamnose 3,5-epimerase-like enzyme
MLGQIRDLTTHADERGRLTELYRLTDDPHGFGQAYVTSCASGIIKAWHRHRHQVDRWVCLAGAAKVGIHDGERGEVVILSADRPQLLTIPAGLWHGFTPCWGHREAVILNMPSRPYDPAAPDEERRGPFSLPFWWEAKSG